MKTLRIIIIVFSTLLLTGCWDYRELEDLAIVSSIGIDIEEDQINVSAQIINSKKVSTNSQGGGGSEEASSFVYQKSAPTIREAITKMVLESPKKLYLGHMDLLIIGEEAAKKGINDFIDFFMRDFEARKIFTTVVAKDAKAIDVLKIVQPLESVTGKSIHYSFEATTRYYGAFSNASFDEIIACRFTEGRHPTIVAVEIRGPIEEATNSDNIKETESKTKIAIIGAGVLKNDKLIEYIGENESVYYSMVRSKVQTTTVSFKCDDKNNYGNIVIDGLKVSLNVEPSTNIPHAEVTMSGEAALTECNCKIDLEVPENIKKIEDMINKKMKNEMKQMISKIQKFNTDIFGYGEFLYRNHYQYWNKQKKKWNEIFPKIETTIKSNIKVIRISSTIDVPKER